MEVFAPRSDKFLITDPNGKMVGSGDTGFVNTIPGLILWCRSFALR